MKKEYLLTFIKAEYKEYSFILSNQEVYEQIASFLLEYISVEAFYKRLLISEKEKNGKKLSKSEKEKLNVTASDVKRVLSYHNVNYDDNLVERVFGSNDKSYMECSIKKLRNRLVHNVNANVLRVILERYDSIVEDLRSFMALFDAIRND